MSSSLRLGLLLASILAFAAVLFFVIKKQLNIKYSIVWLLWALMSLTMAVFPEIFYSFTRVVGIELPVNGVFLIMIGLVYVLTFYVYVMISKHNKEIIDLTYEVASLKKTVEELNKKEEIMKDKMFVIPGSFVPFNDTVTLLTYKRLRNLDLDMDVFALNAKTDESLLEEINNDLNYQKFNVRYGDDLDWVVPRYYPLRLPISLLLMHKYANDCLKEFEKKNYKYLFTSIVPGISHIAGYKIKKKHPEVIWYASFSDPFKGSPYKKSDLSDRSIFYKIAFNVGGYFLYNNHYEEVAVRNADKLIFICDEQRDFTLGQYDDYEKLKEKSIIMPLTYVPEWKMYKDIIDAPKVNHKTRQAVHLGRLYGLRRIDNFLEALKQLNEETEDLDRKDSISSIFRDTA